MNWILSYHLEPSFQQARIQRFPRLSRLFQHLAHVAVPEVTGCIEYITDVAEHFYYFDLKHSTFIKIQASFVSRGTMYQLYQLSLSTWHGFQNTSPGHTLDWTNNSTSLRSHKHTILQPLESLQWGVLGNPWSASRVRIDKGWGV